MSAQVKQEAIRWFANNTAPHKKKKKFCGVTVLKVGEKGESAETESRLVAAWGWGWEQGVVANRRRGF